MKTHHQIPTISATGAAPWMSHLMKQRRWEMANGLTRMAIAITVTPGTTIMNATLVLQNQTRG
jgi:hypothetical protein